MKFIFTTRVEQRSDEEGEYLRVAYPNRSMKSSLKETLSNWLSRHNGYLEVVLSRPRKPRTMRENRKLNAVIQEIASFTGDSFENEKIRVKAEAVAMGFPPPKEERIHGVLTTTWKSEADCDTVECSHLIRAAEMRLTWLEAGYKKG